jgi:hypothetical protein
MEILLAFRSGFHAKCTPENGKKTLERVRQNASDLLFYVNATGYSSARIFFGRSAVMAKGLGATPEEEHREGIHRLANVCYQLALHRRFLLDQNN